LINKRWERNMPNIKAIEYRIEKNKEKIEELQNDTELEDELRQAKIEDLKEANVDSHKEIEKLKKSFDDLVQEAKDDLYRLYLDENDERDWAVAWSGGKDSTTVMGLVVKMLEDIPPEKRTRKIYAVMSDTKMENPNLEEYMHDQVDKLNDYAEKKELPIKAQVVSRPLEQSYYYLVLGKGYFLPQNNGAGRWCTDRLKIKPQNEALKKIDPSYILIGVRLSESAKRKSSIQKWSANEELAEKIGEHADMKNANTFMTIVDFTIEDVWEYLQKERLGWSSTHQVRKLYRDATGECGFSNPKGAEAKASQSEKCGARFGCYSCAVILNDRSTEAMSENNEWMIPLSEFRFDQLKVMGDYKPQRPKGQKRKDRSRILRKWEEINKEIKRVSKSGHKMNGNRMIDKKTKEPRDDQGTVTIEARKWLFDKLIKAQGEVNKLRIQQGLQPLQLIEHDEIEMIKQRWEEDEKERPWLKTNVNNTSINRLDELLAEGEEFTRKVNEGEI